MRRWLLLSVVLASTVRLLIALPGWYAADDLVFKLQAWTLPFWQSVRMPHFGNLMPGGLAVDWVRIRIAPGYESAAVLSVVALAVAAVLVGVLLRDLGLPVRGQIAGVAFFLITPLTAEATLWWSAAMNFVLFLPFVLVALIAMVRYSRSGAAAPIVVMALSQVTALAFFQKAMLMPLWLAAIALLERGGVHRVRRLLLVSAGISTVYAVVYLVAVPSESLRSPGVPRIDRMVQVFVSMLGKQVLPALAGGPWNFVTGAGPSAVRMSILATLLGLIVMALVLYVLPKGRRWRVVAMVLLWTAADLALLALGRGSDPDRIVHASDWTRYVADVSVPLSVAIGMAASVVALRWVIMSGAALVVSAVVGWAQVGQIWWANPGRAWTNTAIDSVGGRTQALLSQSVPEPVAPPAWGPAAAGQGYLAALVPDDAWRQQAPQPYGLTTSGGLGNALGGQVARTTGAVCADASATVPLTSRVPDGTWIARLDVTGSGVLSVRLSEWFSEPVEIQLTRRPTSVFVSFRGAGDSLYVAGAGAWCIETAEVGLVVDGSVGQSK